MIERRCDALYLIKPKSICYTPCIYLHPVPFVQLDHCYPISQTFLRYYMLGNNWCMFGRHVTLNRLADGFPASVNRQTPYRLLLKALILATAAVFALDGIFPLVIALAIACVTKYP